MKTRTIRGAIGLVIGIALTALNIWFTDGVLNLELMEGAFGNLTQDAAPGFWDLLFWIVFLGGAPIGGLLAGLWEDDWFEWFYIPLAAVAGLLVSVASFILMIIVICIITGVIWEALMLFLIFGSLIGGSGTLIVIIFGR